MTQLGISSSEQVKVSSFRRGFRLALDFLFRALQVRTYGYRSTALQPLQWLLAILIAGLVALVHYGADAVLKRVVTILMMAVVALFICCYIVFAWKRPDALRSERYALRLREIEKGLIGDELSGLREPNPSDEPSAKLLPSPDVDEEQ